MSVGSLRTLLSALRTAPTLTAVGAAIEFGQEREDSYAIPLPHIIMIPQGGPWSSPAYYLNSSPDQDGSWMTAEQIDFQLFAGSQSNPATQIDHYEAVEDLRAALLQALQWQTPTGLRYVVTSGRWSDNAQGKLNAYSRAYTLSVAIDISVPGVQPVDAPTPITTTITPSISHG